jgi:AraC-like DNA-binding protein
MTHLPGTRRRLVRGAIAHEVRFGCMPLWRRSRPRETEQLRHLLAASRLACSGPRRHTVSLTRRAPGNTLSCTHRESSGPSRDRPHCAAGRRPRRAGKRAAGSPWRGQSRPLCQGPTSARQLNAIQPEPQSGVHPLEARLTAVVARLRKCAHDMFGRPLGSCAELRVHSVLVLEHNLGQRLGAVVNGGAATTGHMSSLMCGTSTALVALLPDSQWSTVIRAAPSGTRWRRVPDGAACVAALEQRWCTCAVVDPNLVNDVPFDRVVIAAANVAARLVFVGELTQRAVAACLLASVLRPTPSLFTDVADQSWLRFVLHNGGTSDVPALVLHRATPVIAALPMRLQLATAGLFNGGNIAPSAQLFSCSAGISRKTLQRWYANVGLAPPAGVLTVARLARTWRLLQSRRLSIARVSGLVGFGSARTLSRRCHGLAHCGPANLRNYSDLEFAERLACALLPHESQNGATLTCPAVGGRGQSNDAHMLISAIRQDACFASLNLED